jgi:hypothetical protein
MYHCGGDSVYLETVGKKLLSQSLFIYLFIYFVSWTVGSSSLNQYLVLIS